MLNFLTKTLVVRSVTAVRNLTAFESVQRLTSITVQNVMSFRVKYRNYLSVKWT